MGPGNSNSPTSTKIQSFLESLRASRANQGQQDREVSGANPFKEIQIKKEIEQKRIDLFRQSQNNEQVRIYSAKEKEKEQRIQSLISQIKNLAHSVKRLDTSLKTATETRVVEASTYQETFLEHLANRIALIQKSVNNTNTLLDIFNSRSSKQRSYQSLARSNGSAYTQNNEVAIARSVG